MYCELNSVLSSANCMINEENFKVKEDFFVTTESNLKQFITDLFTTDLSNVNDRDEKKTKLQKILNKKPNDMSELFRDKKFTQEIYDVLDIAKWDVSAVTNMNKMFMNSNFNENISNWDVSGVVTGEGFSDMFLNAKNFNGDISKWKFSTNFEQSFFNDLKKALGFSDNLRPACKPTIPPNSEGNGGVDAGEGLVTSDRLDRDGYWYINKSRPDGISEYIGYKDNCDCFERTFDVEGFKKDSCGNCKSFSITTPDELRGKFDDQKNDNGEYFDGSCDCDGNKLDCNGECGGTAETDECNKCAGGNTGKIPNSDKDCAGVCNGDSKIDDCGVCGGDGLPCNVEETDNMTVFQFTEVDKVGDKILITFDSDLIYTDLSENLKREVVLKVYNHIKDILNGDDAIDSIILYEGSIKMFILLSDSVSNNDVDRIVDNFKNYNIETSTGNSLNVENVSVLNSGKYFRMFLIFVIVIMLIILGMCLYKKYYK